MRPYRVDNDWHLTIQPNLHRIIPQHVAPLVLKKPRQQQLRKRCLVWWIGRLFKEGLLSLRATKTDIEFRVRREIPVAKGEEYV